MKDFEYGFWIFVVGSFLGFILETLFCYRKTKEFKSRKGLIYGPFTPVYGVGALLFCLICYQSQNILFIYLVSFLGGGIVEYIFSFLQEKIFGTISWDYSHRKYNFHGRTCLHHMNWWGLLGLIFYKTFYPLLIMILNGISSYYSSISTQIFMVFMMYNIFISFMAAYRQRRRYEKVEANNKFEIYLDKTYPDERMDQIFENKKMVFSKNC